MKHALMAIAGLCIVLAAALMWRKEFNAAFVVAVVGVVAWFLNYRSQIKRANESHREQDFEADENDNEPQS